MDGVGASHGLGKEIWLQSDRIEDSGDVEPWDADLTGPCMLIIGGERHGIPDELLAQCDVVLRIPMGGFLPSYNLQAPLAVVATEVLRQNRGNS